MIGDVADAVDGARESADVLGLAAKPTNDLGLAERLIARFGDQLAKTPEEGWVAWSGKVWETNHKGEARARIFAHKTAQALWDEFNAAKAASDAALAKADEPLAKRWGMRAAAIFEIIDSAGDNGKTNAMLSQAAPYLGAEIGEFDPDPMRICVENGTLELDFINEPCLVAYDDGAAVAFCRAAAGFEAGELVRVGGWSLTLLPATDDTSLRTVRVLAPGYDEGDEDNVGLSDLKAGLTRGELQVRHRLYHLAVKLVPHDPAHRITRIAGCAYDPKAKAPKWRSHIETVMADRDDRNFLQRALGYGLTGSTQSQCFVFVQGKGADGKSTTFRAVDHVLGGYGRMCDPRSWLETKQRSAADASPDMADMAGDTRLLYCEEPPKGARVNEALLKAASGGAPLKARQLHRSLFEFFPRFVLFMAFNDLPRVSGGDDGFWRRMRLVRFRRQFTEAEQLAAGDMVAQLVAEGPGILNWLLEGLAAWKKFGLAPHARMAEDILEYRSQSNPFGEWFRDRVEVKTGVRELNSTLYKDYKDYLETQGVDGREVMGTKAFANQLSSLQISLVKIRGDRYRVGVRLLPKDDPLAPGDGGAE